MKRIGKIDLHGMDVFVHWLRRRPAWAPRDCENGCTDPTRTPWRIWVSTVGSEASQRDSLMHEITHALDVSSDADLEGLRGSGYEAEENRVHRLTGALLDFLERNPEVVKELSRKGA